LTLGYFDCFAGASGDMILASLFDLGFGQQDLLDGIRGLGVGGIDIQVKDVTRKGIRAKAFEFASSADPEPRPFGEIHSIIDRSGLSPMVRERSLRAFHILAEAESKVHGVGKTEVHFHEVGALDSIVDVVGSFIGMEKLGIDSVISSPLALGHGSIDCEHGTIPVPAPATLEIATGLPVRGWLLDGELTTPTGAAILKACATGFGEVPSMKLSAVGYGAGSRDLEKIPNIIRLLVGERSDYEADRVVLVETNIDDMNPQFFSHLYPELFATGALDVWTASILMKKGRLGFLLKVLAERQDVSAIVDFILGETTTSGVRLMEVERVKLPRDFREVETRYGKVKVKVFHVETAERCAPEYEDCLRIARVQGVSVSDVMEEAKNAFNKTRKDSL
jgi:uncharacterized protein (TIGR00299 family) protein